MITPPDGSDRVHHPLPAEALKASMLYRAAAPLLPDDKMPRREENLTVYTQEIKNFFYRFRIKNLTYDALMSFPLSVLSPAEKSFVLFLRKNPAIFKRLSFMDQKPGSLSVQDVVMASRLAGDALVLSDRDLEYLREVPRQLAAETPEEPDGPAHFTADEISGVLARFHAEGVHYRELQQLNPGAVNLTGREAAILLFLQSQPLQKMLYNLSLPYGGLLLPEMIRVLVSLIWNPLIHGAVPIVFLKGPDEEDEEEVEPAVRAQEIHSDDEQEDGQGALPLTGRKKVWLHAAEILEILHAMSPGADHVTLEQLRAYRPQNEKHAGTLHRLQQGRIFRALAQLDGEGDSLSEQDIRLAMKEGVLLIADPYLAIAVLL